MKSLSAEEPDFDTKFSVDVWCSAMINCHLIGTYFYDGCLTEYFTWPITSYKYQYQF